MDIGKMIYLYVYNIVNLYIFRNCVEYFLHSVRGTTAHTVHFWHDCQMKKYSLDGDATISARKRVA